MTDRKYCFLIVFRIHQAIQMVLVQTTNKIVQGIDANVHSAHSIPITSILNFLQAIKKLTQTKRPRLQARTLRDPASRCEHGVGWGGG